MLFKTTLRSAYPTIATKRFRNSVASSLCEKIPQNHILKVVTDAPDHTKPEFQAPNAQLTNTLSAVLRPLVRLMLHRQFTYPQLASMLKGIFVEVAEEEFRNGQKRQSDSRIHLLTGVHRKDVKRLRETSEEASPLPTIISTGPQLIAQWLGDPDYVTPDGRPLPISFKETELGKPCFESLVKRVVKKDIRARVILDEWLRLGVAEFDGEYVTLNSGAFTPEKGFEEKAFFFAKNIRDHIAASSGNLLGEKPLHFDRSAFYDQLSAQSVKELKQLANELGMQALTAMNNAAMARQKTDQYKETAQHRMNFGIFSFDSLPKLTRPQGPERETSEEESSGKERSDQAESKAQISAEETAKPGGNA